MTHWIGRHRHLNVSQHDQDSRFTSVLHKIARQLKKKIKKINPRQSRPHSIINLQYVCRHIVQYRHHKLHHIHFNFITQHLLHGHKKPNNKTTPTSPTHINHEGVNLVDREEEDPSLLGRQSLELLACLIE